MQNPIDNQGRKWSLIKISDKVGRQTIQAYRNHWIPGKGSRVAQRISVGRLNDDGALRSSAASWLNSPNSKALICIGDITSY